MATKAKTATAVAIVAVMTSVWVVSNAGAAYAAGPYQVIATVPVGAGPAAVAVAPDGTHAYATNTTAGTVSVIDTTTETQTALVTVGNNPGAIGVSPDGRRVYVANTESGIGSGSVAVIDATTNTVTATVTVGGYPAWLAVAPDGQHVYVSNENDNTISVIDTATNTVSATVLVLSAAPLAISDVAVSPDSSRLYVSLYGEAAVAIIDTSTNAVVSTTPVGGGPLGLAVSPDGTRLYVANNYNHSVSVVDTATDAVAATVPVGSSPGDVVVSPDGGHVYVSDGVMSVIDTTTETVTATLPAGIAPAALAVATDGNRIYATQYTSNSVIVIGPTPADSTPPSLSLSIVGGTPGNTPWYTSPPSVDVQASDAASGASAISVISCNGQTLYSGSPTDPDTASASFPISGQGAITVTCTATDAAGNTSAPSAITVRVDTVGPSVSCTASPTYVLDQPAASVSAAVADATSGPASATVSAPVSTAALGTFSAPVTGQDVAGNQTGVACGYSVAPGFLGFQSPQPGSTRSSNATLAVKFRLGTWTSTPLADAIATQLQTRVSLASDQAGLTRLATTTCTYGASNQTFQCNVKAPPATPQGQYWLIVESAVNGAWVSPPPVPAATTTNPEQINLK